jgi:hypothetical protein
VTKSSRLTIRLSAEVRAWLKAEGDQRGLDEAAFARMLIYGAMNGANEVAARFTFPVDDAAPSSETVTSPTMRAPLADRDFADEQRAEEIDVPADADGGDAGAQLDALMAAAPSFFDDLMARSRAPAAQPALPARQPPRVVNPDPLPRSYRQPAPARGTGKPDHRRGYGVAPGSLTRAVGVGRAGGNIQGDGFGNVQRDNMRHFGIVGTRAR